MSESAPSLTEALATVLERALTETKDRWIRAELSTDLPVADSLAILLGRVDGLRVGLLRPFSEQDVEGADVSSTASPPTLTSWRNLLGSAETQPTVVLGDALGPEEAGLRKASRIVYDAEILGEWQASLRRWFETNVNAQPAQDLVGELFKLAKTGLVDPTALGAYLDEVTSQEDEVLSKMRTELWRLNLLEDSLLLDDPHGRIQRNLDAKRLLLAAPDSPSDAKRIERLEAEAEKGNETAISALKYRESSAREDLSGIVLSNLEKLFAKKGDGPPKPPPAVPRKVGLIEFLDSSEHIGAQETKRVLDALEAAWDNREDQAEPEAEVEYHNEPLSLSTIFDDGKSRVDIDLRATAPDERPWVGDGTPEAQTVWFLLSPAEVSGWPPGNATGMSGAQLVDRAKNQDLLVGTTDFEKATVEYLTTRANLSDYERWFRYGQFEVLLFSSDARRFVRDFIAAWENLIDYVAAVAPEDAGELRTNLALLEATWGGDAANQESLEVCALGPLHPFLLMPRLRLAEYAHETLGERELGQKVRWGLDRSVPSYRAIWAPSSTLVLAKEGEVFEYHRPTQAGHHPPATSGDGILQVVKAFTGYHPYTKDALVLTFVDPPKGGAVQRGIQRVKDSVAPNLRVYSLATGSDVTRLDEAGDSVHDFGRFAHLRDWVDSSPTRSHIVFVFIEHTGGIPLSGGERGPTRGAHIAPTIRLGQLSLLSSEQSPYVTFAPREDNSVVVKLRSLLAPGGETKLFELPPLVTEDQIRELENLRDIADWVVVGAPAPLGLVVPTELAEGFTYVGREGLGTYGLFVFATDQFAIRKTVLSGLRATPVAPDPDQVEGRLTDLALRSPNGVLRIGRATENLLWPQIGELLSSILADEVDERLHD